MRRLRRRITVLRKRLSNRIGQEMSLRSNWQFVGAVAELIWEFRGYSLAILVVTVFQEIAALWPVNLLGQFVDRLQSGDLGNVVWLFLGASVLHPAIARGNVMLRHKMFYESDFKKRVELTLKVSAEGVNTDIEAAGAAHTRVINAVSGITNATHHILGSFTPVIIKIIVVSGSLLAYNQLLGLTYLGSLAIPAIMTVLFNKKLIVLRDAQYSVISKVSGTGVKVISERGNLTLQQKFREIMRERKNIMIALICKSQVFLYLRQVILIGSQFLVIFLALWMRDDLNLTPGDFTRIVGYTAQVAGAFLGAASVVDAIISYTRAYHVYARSHGALG